MRVAAPEGVLPKVGDRQEVPKAEVWLGHGDRAMVPSRSSPRLGVYNVAVAMRISRSSSNAAGPADTGGAACAGACLKQRLEAGEVTRISAAGGWARATPGVGLRGPDPCHPSHLKATPKPC
jgi:hypothetical protein